MLYLEREPIDNTENKFATRTKHCTIKEKDYMQDQTKNSANTSGRNSFCSITNLNVDEITECPIKQFDELGEICDRL